MKYLNTKISACFLAIAVLLFLTVACNDNPDDQDIQENVTKRLQENQNYKGVSAVVKDGIVTLSGKCEGDDCASEIEKNVKEVEGVQTVENNIQKDNKTDLTLRTSVQAIISKYEGVQADVAGGVVVLRGTIDRNQVQPLMNELEALHPEKIDNQLAVK